MKLAVVAAVGSYTAADLEHKKQSLRTVLRPDTQLDMCVADSGVPLRVRDHTTAFSAYFTDPFGNALEVTTYEHEDVRRGEHRVSIAVMTVNNPSHAYGKATLEGMSRRLLRGLEPIGTVGAQETAAQFSR